MLRIGFEARLAGAWLALLAAPALFPQAVFPAAETLTYGIEWRLIYAGAAHLTLSPANAGKQRWNGELHVESGGLVSKLYKLDDQYTAKLEDQFCTASTHLNAIEGKRHRETTVNFDAARGKAAYVERDLLKNAVTKTSEVDIPACASDILGGFYRLRTMKLEPGQTAQIPLSDGRKTVMSRVEVQEREQIETKLGKFKTLRCEAFVFNGVLFARKGRLFVWLTDDARKLPVQISAKMSFPIGAITLQLEKDGPG